MYPDTNNVALGKPIAAFGLFIGGSRPNFNATCSLDVTAGVVQATGILYPKYPGVANDGITFYEDSTISSLNSGFAIDLLERFDISNIFLQYYDEGPFILTCEYSITNTNDIDSAVWVLESDHPVGGILPNTWIDLDIAAALANVRFIKFNCATDTITIRGLQVISTNTDVELRDSSDVILTTDPTIFYDDTFVSDSDNKDVYEITTQKINIHNNAVGAASACSVELIDDTFNFNNINPPALPASWETRYRMRDGQLTRKMWLAPDVAGLPGTWVGGLSPSFNLLHTAGVAVESNYTLQQPLYPPADAWQGTIDYNLDYGSYVISPNTDWTVDLPVWISVHMNQRFTVQWFNFEMNGPAGGICPSDYYLDVAVGAAAPSDAAAPGTGGWTTLRHVSYPGPGLPMFDSILGVLSGPTGTNINKFRLWIANCVYHTGPTVNTELYFKKIFAFGAPARLTLAAPAAGTSVPFWTKFQDKAYTQFEEGTNGTTSLTRDRQTMLRTRMIT